MTAKELQANHKLYEEMRELILDEAYGKLLNFIEDRILDETAATSEEIRNADKQYNRGLETVAKKIEEYRKEL